MTGRTLTLAQAMLKFVRAHAIECEECFPVLEWPMPEVPGYAVADFAADFLLPAPVEVVWHIPLSAALAWFGEWQKERIPA